MRSYHDEHPDDTEYHVLDAGRTLGRVFRIAHEHYKPPDEEQEADREYQQDGRVDDILDYPVEEFHTDTITAKE